MYRKEPGGSVPPGFDNLSYDTFYGAHEFIIRDCNRFWITFGQPVE